MPASVVLGAADYKGRSEGGNAACSVLNTLRSGFGWRRAGVQCVASFVAFAGEVASTSRRARSERTTQLAGDRVDAECLLHHLRSPPVARSRCDRWISRCTASK